ncbi:putative UDP-galactose transporter [Gigaspora margarita]|uniref:Putative UDP-galactose transporter n=1 Tax=Gigaspora margarita TaxID=4874 RepID=A0A8H4ACX0_GIGMA|nr:putative UDP-galactose transporter [Gigaspora margarita]
MSRKNPSIFATIVYQGVYLLAGFYQTLIIQYLYYQGAAHEKSLLVNVALYIGAALTGILLMPTWFAKRKVHEVIIDKTDNPEFDMGYQLLSENDDDDNLSSPKEVVNYRFIFAISLLDIIVNITLTLGLFYIGSGMYQIIHSSIVIWCAILSFLFLGRKFSRVQLLCVIGACIGLLLCSYEEPNNSVNNTSTRPVILNFLKISPTIIGVILTSLASFGGACVYVTLDKLLTTNRVPNEIPLSPEKASFLIGIINSSLIMIYIIIYTIPNWKILVIEEIEKKPEHTTFWIVKYIGNVTIGLLNSIRAIMVFGFSYIFFCKIDNEQCFTIWKGFGAFIVIGCVTIFSLTKLRYYDK